MSRGHKLEKLNPNMLSLLLLSYFIVVFLPWEEKFGYHEKYKSGDHEHRRIYVSNGQITGTYNNTE